MLYHLRSVGLRGRQLYRLHCCYVMSWIEYCSAVYHAMLNKGQEEQLESIQRHALRICFGINLPIEELMAENGVETLKARRMRRCDAFTRKAWASPRFGPKWFPPRENGSFGNNNIFTWSSFSAYNDFFCKSNFYSLETWP